MSGSKLSNSSTVSRASSVKPSQERHPLHGAVKFLMFTMEKYLPGEGLAHAHLRYACYMSKFISLSYIADWEILTFFSV